LAISTVVIFQPEIRRILAQVGAFGFLERRKHTQDGVATAQYVVETLMTLSEKRIGALIAFERGISLRSYESTGVQLNADFSQELVQSVFTPPLPLHDGGMTMRAGRISSAHCVFPVSNNPNLISIGMRHRAAVGLSEETDALIVVVSEETGAISIAHNGRLLRYFNDQIPQSLPRWISKAMSEDHRKSKIFTKLYSVLMNSRLMKGLRR
jgi:diadenylate cyclase